MLLFLDRIVFLIRFAYNPGNWMKYSISVRKIPPPNFLIGKIGDHLTFDDALYSGLYSEYQPAF
jgi:hypothetical protein